MDATAGHLDGVDERNTYRFDTPRLPVMFGLQIAVTVRSQAVPGIVEFSGCGVVLTDVEA